MKLTEWFPASVKPVRTGWYKCRFARMVPVWRYWSGSIWKMDTCGDECELNSIDRLSPKTKSCFGDLPYEKNEAWRGLASEPMKVTK